MKLYLVQHAAAVPKEVDEQRPLSERGRQDLEKIADFIKPLGVRLGDLWHSPKTRARQTAEILRRALHVDNFVEKEGLKPKDEVDMIIDEIEKAAEDIMIVSHMPFVGRLATELLCGKFNDDIIAFRQGGIVCLELGEDDIWQVAWIVTPEILRI